MTTWYRHRNVNVNAVSTVAKKRQTTQHQPGGIKRQKPRSSGENTLNTLLIDSDTQKLYTRAGGLSSFSQFLLSSPLTMSSVKTMSTRKSHFSYLSFWTIMSTRSFGSGSCFPVPSTS